MRRARRLLLVILRALPGGEAVIQQLRRWLARPLAGPATGARAARLALVIPPDLVMPDLRRALGADIPVVRAGEDPFAVADYAMFLEAGSPVPRPEHLHQALLCLAHQPLDFLLLSNSLVEAPHFAAGALGNHLVVNPAARSLLSGGPPAPGLRGRMLRLMPAAKELPISNLTNLWPTMQAELATLVLPGPAPQRPPRPFRLPAIAGARDARPLVFVMPVFLAVGGVERNTVEVMRALCDRYDFVVITSERQAARQGSLHHQLEGIALAWFDLMELGENPLHLAFLETLAALWHPDLVWICNGSPWINDNAGRLRALFQDIPIIDQQVYDTEIGFIQRTGDPDVQRFDRFIAVNRKIRKVFVERLNMDPDRIDLIYSAIDASRFERPVPDESGRQRLAEKWAVPRDRRVFAYIGRVAAQKRPFDYLELAARALAAGSTDHFLMVGDGDMTPVVEQAIADRGLANMSRIRFCDDLTELYPLIDGLVVTSDYEGLPIVLLESLAAGVPALATDVGDIRYVVEEYGSGKVQDGRIGDQDDLWECFQAWASELPALKERAVAAAPLVRRRFGVSAIADQYNACWTGAIARRHAVAP